jgi:hypothetical protein
MVEERWNCVFYGRAGGHASATFDSPEEAKEFASRHAQIIGSGGEWTAEASGSWLLRTDMGTYRVNPLASAPVSPTARHLSFLRSTHPVHT